MITVVYVVVKFMINKMQVHITFLQNRPTIIPYRQTDKHATQDEQM